MYHIEKVVVVTQTSRALDGYVTRPRWDVMHGRHVVRSFDRKFKAVAFVAATALDWDDDDPTAGTGQGFLR